MAGVYSGISILSNALYYVCFLLVWIILPELKINDDKVNHRILTTAYKLLALLGGSALIVELIFKGLVARLLLGSSFAAGGNLLVFATLYQISLVAITIYAYYLLVNRRRRVALLSALILVGCLVVPAKLASSPLDMIQLLWLSLLAGYLVYWLLVKMIKYSRPNTGAIQ